MLLYTVDATQEESIQVQECIVGPFHHIVIVLHEHNVELQ